MSYQSGSYRDGITTISAGTDEYIYNDFNFAESREAGLFAADRSHRFDPDGICEVAIAAGIAGQGGASAQVGERIEIDDNPSGDLEITANAVWNGLLEVNLAGGCRMDMLLIVMEDDGPLWPEDWPSSVIDSTRLVEKSGDITNTGSPITTQGNVYTDGNPAPLQITSPSDGDQYRVVAAVEVSASVPYTAASARADASSNGSNAFDGHLTLASLELNWN